MNGYELDLSFIHAGLLQKKALARESHHYHSVKIQRFSEQYILSHPDYITGRKSNSFPSGQGKGGGGGLLFWAKYVIFASLF